MKIKTGVGVNDPTFINNIEVFASVAGSFNKSFDIIQKTIRSLKEIGITVLSPRLAGCVNNIEGFLILDGDEGSPSQIEKRHLMAISKSDFLLVVNPDGYIGRSTALEIGFALSRGIPIYCTVKPCEIAFSDLVESGLTLVEIKNIILSKKSDLEQISLKKNITLPELQEYIFMGVKRRGFSDENLEDVILLLFEEIGELAKAIRRHQGLKFDENSPSRNKEVGEEIADCLIYLIDLANLASINVEKAIREKEIVNEKRHWIKNR